MERVAFLIDDTGERISCLLNPASLVRRRVAGLRTRRSLGGVLSSRSADDDPLVYTGGGTTDLLLDLLFDVSLSGSTIATEDVRDLTQPLWDLAENDSRPEREARPPLVRFIWGKSWNFPGVIAAVSERLEFFTVAGVPRRSWLRLRMLRAGSSATAAPERERRPAPVALLADVDEERGGDARTHDIIGGPDGDSGEPRMERLDEIAWRYYADPAIWRDLARLNDIDQPLRLQPAMRLRVP
jgi:hypothetical protein